MFAEIALGVWSVAGIVWWVIAWRLVSTESFLSQTAPKAAGEKEELSIFKPLPPLKEDGLADDGAALETFVSQLDDRSELLLGVHEADRAQVAPFLARMRELYPAARLQVIYRSEPDGLANPKIAWEKILSVHAQGELWLWSDIDIMAPPGFLSFARREFAEGGAALLTFPYVVRGALPAAASLDALYVNIELYPGVLLLGRRGLIDFGLGAGLLFRRSVFLRDVGWEKIGEALADDFVLGQGLKPVRLSRKTLVTTTHVKSWKAALLHHLRWSRTVWWSRPVGSAARILVLPVLGWMLAVALYPGSLVTWLGLAVMVQIDVIFAAALCTKIECDWRARNLLASGFWSFWRVLVWVACWLPWPVVWRGSLWWRPLRK